MTDIFFLNVLGFFQSKGQGVISAFSRGQGAAKRGQGAAPCKRSLGRTLSSFGGLGYNCCYLGSQTWFFGENGHGVL